jgi:methionyl-tRNA formyltransferase
MRLGILSTPSKHHTYFINKLHERFDIVSLVYERRRLKKNFPVGPFFAAEEDAFEDRFSDPARGGVASEVVPQIQDRMIEVLTVNQVGVTEYLKALNIQVLVVFGTGKVDKIVTDAAQWGSVNVHRGMIQDYRGLDADLWAIWHGRFDRIGVTLHEVASDLDSGDIYAQDCVRLRPEDEIFHLRYHTTLLATELMLDILEKFNRTRGPIKGEKQITLAPYYTAMSLEQKFQALERFQRHKKTLINT